MWLRFVLTLAAMALLVSDGFSDQKASEVPKACSQTTIETYGRPVMFQSRDGVAFGISTLRTTVPKDGEATVYLWLSNESQSSRDYLACCNLTMFEKIDVFDSAGQRLESASDVQLKTLQDKGQAYVSGCSCSAMLTIAPGSCCVVDQGAINRKDIAYTLPPGRYTVRERPPSGSYPQSPPTPDSRKKTGSLSIIIEDH